MAEGYTPLTGMDYPDPDFIRVGVWAGGEVYYGFSDTLRTLYKYCGRGSAHG